MRRVRAAGLVVATILLSVAAADRSWSAPRSQAAIVAPPGADALLVEIVTRLSAELSGAGFEVVKVPTAAAPGPARPVAIFEVTRTPGETAVDVRVLDRLSDKLVARRISLGPGAGPGIVAIRAVELLRASLLEISVDPPPAAQPPPPVPADVRRWIGPVADGAPRAPLAGFGLGAGIVFLGGADLVTRPAVAPGLRVSYGLASVPFVARLTVVGPSTAQESRTVAGRASLQQALALVDLAWMRPLGARWAVLASVGGGGYRLRSAGNATAPYRGVVDTATTALGDAGLGLGLRLGRRALLLAEAHLYVLFPQVTVRLADVPATTYGRPSALAALSLVSSW